jgi:hypothetical protein
MCLLSSASSPVPGCPGQHGPARSPGSSAWAQASRSALSRDYTHAVQVSLVFNLAAVALACQLAFFFPRRAASAGQADGAG